MADCPYECILCVADVRGKQEFLRCDSGKWQHRKSDTDIFSRFLGNRKIWDFRCSNNDLQATPQMELGLSNGASILHDIECEEQAIPPMELESSSEDPP